MKYYEFVDKQPAIGKLVIVEGTERTLAERALDALVDRLLPDMRELNLERFPAAALSDTGRLREAVQAMPFLAARRVVIVTDAQTLRAAQRRDLWEAAQVVPDGNTLVIADLLAPRSQKPPSLGSLAGRAALRIDTTPDEEARARFIEEALSELDATAEPRVVAVLARGESDLASVRNDLQKLALGGRKIALRDLEEEALAGQDPKAYKYASALVAGNLSEALGIAHELFAGDPRGAAIPLLNALATECGMLWEMARPGGQLPARAKWRERVLRPLAARVGERRARIAYERAVRGVEAIVTGRAGSDPDDHRTLVERISAELAGMSRPVR